METIEQDKVEEDFKKFQRNNNASQDKRITLLEEEIKNIEKSYKTIENNTLKSENTASKLSLLLILIGAIITIVTSATMFTFTSLNEFKTSYSQNRLELQKNIFDLSSEIDFRTDIIERKVVRLETKTNSPFEELVK